MPDEHLRQAVLLAKQGHTDEALKFVKRHVRDNMNDERGWYLIARLVSDERIKREAIERVLQINPYHEKALALLNELDARADTFIFENVSLFDSAPPAMPIPSQDMFTEATYANEVLPDVNSDFFRLDQLPIKTTHSKKMSRTLLTDILITLGVVLLGGLIVVGMGYYAYAYQHRGIFGLFGPDLSKVANTGTFSVRYPSNWQGVMNDGGMVAVNSDLNRLGFGEAENLSAEVLLADEALLERTYGDDGLQLIIMTPVTPEVLAALQTSRTTSYASAHDYVQQTMSQMTSFANDDTFTTEVKDQRIGGSTGILGITQVAAPDASLYLELYMGAVTYNGREYLFMFIAVGNQEQSHARLVRRVLQSVKFSG